jgi:Isocitrate/isopropylmalate dehydrogenase
MAARLLIDQGHEIVLHGRNEGRSRDALAAAAGAWGVVSGDLSTIAEARTVADEVTEGEYSGVGGRTHKGLPIEVAQDVSVMTRAGVQRIIRYAFKLAQPRPRKLLTVVTKSNAQRHAMVMWDEIAAEVAAEFPDVTWDKMLVDAMTMRMVMKPQTLDTIVATNLHADILSDLAAALAGSLGIAPTANINPGAGCALDVRAHPWLRLRHHRQGHRQPGRYVLDRRDDAGAPG